MDGNIILAVGSGRDDACLFRVYRTQLAMQSEVFRDMLNLPRTTSETKNESKSEMLDDVPVLRMDDSVKDVRSTFALLWDIPPQAHQALPSDLLGILRIATKYVIPKAREWSITAIDSIFPSDPAERYNATHFARWREEQHAVDLILTSYLCNVSSLLPHAYYALATTDWSDHQLISTMGISRLASEHQLLLGGGRTFLQEQLGRRFIAGGPHSEPIGYHHVQETCSGTCASGPGVVWSPTEPYLVPIIKKADPIRWIKDQIVGCTDTWGFCAGCRKEWMKQAHAKIDETFDGFCSSMKLPAEEEASATVLPNME
ncbi:hypothetical protein FRB95_001873 [Tulasnella sp. JGI-2019a]|nr:hypothetical protein FRB93_006421 [Tulasnella sp. JGI-2019a]KAG9021600.1 hypothetical protein FRB95_001873 [Tulasnella sp. JGI-2019a]